MTVQIFWDYYVTGNSSQGHSAWNSLLRGLSGGSQNSLGNEMGIDFFIGYPNNPSPVKLDITKPNVIFIPK